MMTQSDHSNRPGRSDKEVAVALTHRPGSAAPPRISATGRGPVAEQIVRIALDNGVRVREDADLASILSALEVDSVIPLEAFAAVAEILSYLYRANGANTEEIEKAVAAGLWDPDAEETGDEEDGAAWPDHPSWREDEPS
jgi:flagellar biosynthesis protein